MNKVIEQVLEELSEKQMNLASSSCRELLAKLISDRIRTKFYSIRLVSDE